MVLFIGDNWFKFLKIGFLFIVVCLFACTTSSGEKRSCESLEKRRAEKS